MSGMGKFPSKTYFWLHLTHLQKVKAKLSKLDFLYQLFVSFPAYFSQKSFLSLLKIFWEDKGCNIKPYKDKKGKLYTIEMSEEKPNFHQM